MAVIAYVPWLASARIPFGLALLVAVAALTRFGHGGRLAFAGMTRARGASRSATGGRDSRRSNAAGALAVALTLAVNLGPGLRGFWRRAGRPSGIEEVERHAESED